MIKKHHPRKQWQYWLFLLAAILFEVLGTSVMKVSQKTWAVTGLLVMYACLGLSYFCLAKAVVKIPLGVAYAFWEGLGIFCVALISIFWLDERLDTVRLLALGMIIGGTLLINHGTDSGDISV